ncbi:hypothetical protein RRU94_16210 [Domibacillus sp. DTU_2020_1001157_1_SI_ALB_TIR_016]|uniref:hypothetical protein n=1 Tax=Domibacillus sp. DTU_2020_1001157_1_SI_ALB_TIR_016 TaxID=3077789 RepID=UPI0028ECE53F|nr:hypothetical protein [Domibacillus sp. DTU_2020_1001157_1_SI_ALB_TIR_016]WNS82279.1 hypothetical protein RRU94_16210 [Domibacillus sp. DTU_2020_1001157_1_SI_ALB_TIR_016]
MSSSSQDDQNIEHQEKRCDCCCIPGLESELKKLESQVISVITKSDIEFTGRLIRVDSYILVLKDIDEPTPTFIYISLCEISAFIFITPLNS